MANDDEPIAFFITWTVYGSYLQGDQRGWRRWKGGPQAAQPILAEWRRERLTHPVLLLNDSQQLTVEHEIERHCEFRNWHLWTTNARTNHVHVVATAHGYSGKTVRDQLKANCTRGLRERWNEFRDRPVWAAGGDWECINDEENLATVIEYVAEAQDKMAHKNDISHQ